MRFPVVVVFVACSSTPRPHEADDERRSARVIRLQGDRASIHGELGAGDRSDWIRVDRPSPPRKLIVEFRPTPHAHLGVMLYGRDETVYTHTRRETSRDGTPVRFEIDPAPRTIFARIDTNSDATGHYDLELVFSRSNPQRTDDPDARRPDQPQTQTGPVLDDPAPCSLTVDPSWSPGCKPTPSMPPQPAPIELKIRRAVGVPEGVRLTYE